MGKLRTLGRLTFSDVESIRAACAAGERQKDVAARYGVAASTVNKIVRGHTRKKPFVLPSREEVKSRLDAYQRRWRKENAEHVRKYISLNNHSFNMGGRVSTDEWDAILETFDNRCAYCGVRDKLSIEHVIPACRGGKHEVDNIVPACGSCNFVKGRRGPLAMVNRNFELRDA